MHARRNKRGAVLAAVGLATITATMWTTGLAGAHGGDSSKVHACVVPASGTIRIVEPGQSCRDNETALDWTSNAGGTYSAGSGLALSAHNEFSVTGAPWSGLTGVPAGFADGVDNDGSGQVAQLRSDLANGFISIDGRSITAGSLRGSSIASGSIQNAQLAGEYRDDGTQYIVGAVTSNKIADGSIEARDLSSAVVQRLEALEAMVATLEAKVAALEAG